MSTTNHQLHQFIFCLSPRKMYLFKQNTTDVHRRQNVIGKNSKSYHKQCRTFSFLDYKNMSNFTLKQHSYYYLNQ